MIRRLWCRWRRHDHSKVVILCQMTDGGKPLQSHPLDRWSAEWIVVNVIAPTGTFAGRRVASCRIVTL